MRETYQDESSNHQHTICVPLCLDKSVNMNRTTTKRRIVVFTGNSNSGSACIEEVYAMYADRVVVRAIFRSEEKAGPYRQRYPALEVFANVDASKPDTLNNVFSGCDVAVLVTPHDPNRGMNDDAKLTETMIMKAIDSGDVKYIVYVGSFTCNFPDTIPIISSRFIPSESLLAKLGTYCLYHHHHEYMASKGLVKIAHYITGLGSGFQSHFFIIQKL